MARTTTSQDLIEKTQALIRPLADLCTEMMRQDPIRIVDRVISSEDLEAHFDTLKGHLAIATERHQRNPSLASSMLVTTIAALIHERALEVTTRPSRLYQKTRQMLERAIENAAHGPTKLGSLTLNAWHTYRKDEELRSKANVGEVMTLGLPNAGGAVLVADDGEIYRFATLVAPQHTCRVPRALTSKQRITLTVAEPGAVAFTAGCECGYIASNLIHDRP